MARNLSRCLLVALTSWLAWGNTSPAQAFEPRVPEGYFGISAPALAVYARDQDPRLSLYADGIVAADLDFVRASIDWRQVEPKLGVGGLHVYNWAATDRLVTALAGRDLEFVPTLLGTPNWARALDATLATCGSLAAIAELHAPSYGAFAKAVMHRYGRGGTFWANNPGLAAKPVRRIEIWNEPNWAGFWCPAPQPERFATSAVEAARGIDSVDPTVEIILGGMVLTKEDVFFDGGGLRGMESGEFLARMVSAQPQLARLLDQVGIHLYDPDPDFNISLLGWFRTRLEAAGLGQAGLLVNEFGWHTSGGPSALSEPARVEAYTALIDQLPRTDCDVRGIAAHTWATDEADASDPEDWFGIADPASGALYPAGEAYRDSVALFNGNGPTPAPRENIGVCGAPPPDQDADGTPDEVDDYPLDATQDSGSGEVPPSEEPPEAPVRPAHVPDSYFSVASSYMPATPEQRLLHFDSMAELGVKSARQSVEWDLVEREASAPAADRFAWSDTDRRIVAYAKRGIATSLAPLHAPAWLSPTPTTADGRFAEFLAALARRYGTGGQLWEENLHLDRALAPRDYEIWTDVNLNSSAWDGSASPSEYATTYATAKSALRTADPSARAIVSLRDGGDGTASATFLRSMVAARPGLAGSIDGVYVMAFSARSGSALDALVARVRQALEASGNPNARLRIGFGAPTSGPNALTEAQRAAFVRDATSRLPRLDCGVDEAVLVSWTSAQADPANASDWFGVAALADASTTTTAQAFVDVARSFQGYGTTTPPRTALHPCVREPLDRDGDGTPDAADPAPLDPSRSEPISHPPPAPRFDSAPAAFSPATSPTLVYSAPSAVTFHCKLDSAAWEPCSGTRKLSGLADGPHRFSVRAVDGIGLVGPGAQHDWTVDTRKPETTIASGPSGLTYSDSVTFGLTGDEPGVRFSCRLDSNPWAGCSATPAFSGLAEGGHTFQAVAIDRAGNVDPSQASRFFEVRTVPGAPTISASGLSTQKPTFTFTAAHAASFECRFDGAPFGACSGSGRHTPARPLPAGPHRFEVRGIGHTGKRGPVAGWSFTTSDSRPPETTITAGPSGTVVGGRVEFRLASDEDEVTYRCKLDTEPWKPCVAIVSYEDLPNGAHVFLAAAVDTAGNTDPTPAGREFITTGDAQDPELTLRVPARSRKPRVTVRFTASDPSGPIVTTCSVDKARWTSCASPFRTRRLKPGKHVVAVRARDSVGNTAEKRGTVKVVRR